LPHLLDQIPADEQIGTVTGDGAFGERIASRDPDRQTAEVQIRVALMNRFNALGTAEIKRVA
jgi:hypothetical protein